MSGAAQGIESWKVLPQDQWSDQEFADATTWVCDGLNIPEERFGGAVQGLLETYGPEEISPEMVEEMTRSQEIY